MSDPFPMDGVQTPLTVPFAKISKDGLIARLIDPPVAFETHYDNETFPHTPTAPGGCKKCGYKAIVVHYAQIELWGKHPDSPHGEFNLRMIGIPNKSAPPFYESLLCGQVVYICRKSHSPRAPIIFANPDTLTPLTARVLAVAREFARNNPIRPHADVRRIMALFWFRDPDRSDWLVEVPFQAPLPFDAPVRNVEPLPEPVKGIIEPIGIMPKSKPVALSPELIQRDGIEGKIEAALRARIGEDRYRMWLAVDKATFAVVGSQLLIGCANAMFSEWIQSAFSRALFEAAAQVLGGRPMLRFAVDPNLFQAARREQQRVDGTQHGQDSSTEATTKGGVE